MKRLPWIRLYTSPRNHLRWVVLGPAAKSHPSMAARALSISFPALLRSFGIGWNLDVVTDELNLSCSQVKKLTDTLELMIVIGILSFALALGPLRFVAGPLAIIVDVVAAGGLLEFNTYLVLAQGKMNGLIGLSEVLFMQDK